MTTEDWGVDDAPPPPPRDEAEAAGISADVGGLAAEYVDAAVTSAVRTEVGGIATQAVQDALTPDLLDALRTQAETSAAESVTAQLDGTEDADDAPAEEEQEQPPELYYGSTDEFLREYLRHVYRRRIDGSNRAWAARWWEHGEAMIRLEALWRSWEHLRLDPATGMSVWWRDHADHHMGVLMDPQGPFREADLLADENTTRGGPLPYLEPPAGMFPDVRESQQ